MWYSADKIRHAQSRIIIIWHTLRQKSRSKNEHRAQKQPKREHKLHRNAQQNQPFAH